MVILNLYGYIMIGMKDNEVIIVFFNTKGEFIRC